LNQSNTILLKTLLNVEYELIKTQLFFENTPLFFSINIHSNHFFDLFEVIISAFSIPEYNFDSLYDILYKFYNADLSIDGTIKAIICLIK